ncbi:TetR/AcrR family transcriptional regulator [Paenibacillus sp. KQZ6P-2]|uniref:TetR/AcrR family transcriptional regulator n=1 Tax=Paenibacillus mangrovi TaxID=2931978 RepID=A0A9X2B493_9BACL|nr:TetR/AcrR family transcriptional regulator [Paenibacillus mangrovi]MCJ8010833.1 TetR/AcrR family transcriptional regulator [Paenibacillus mangrovi]
MGNQEQSQQTIEKLMKSGVELFSRQGYSNTSIDQICKHAGYSKGGFYAHFPSKEEFLLKIIKDGIDFFFDDLKAALEQKDRNLLAKFKDYSLRLLKESYKQGSSLLLIQGCMNSNELPMVKERLIQQMEEWRQFLTYFFQAMKDEGIVGSPLDARILATTSMALFNGINLQHFVDERIQIEDMLPVILDLLHIQESK